MYKLHNLFGRHHNLAAGTPVEANGVEAFQSLGIKSGGLSICKQLVLLALVLVHHGGTHLSVRMLAHGRIIINNNVFPSYLAPHIQGRRALVAGWYIAMSKFHGELL